MQPTSQSLSRITIRPTCQSRQGQVQPFWGTASPWKLVKDARIDLGLIISVIRWATLHTIVHAARAVVEEASRAKDSIMDLEDEVIFRVVEGLEEDMVEVGVTTPSPEEIFSLHQGQTQRNKCRTPSPQFLSKQHTRNRSRKTYTRANMLYVTVIWF
jgi:hypothetical protein